MSTTNETHELGYTPANTADEALRAFTMSQLPRDRVVEVRAIRAARRDDAVWAKEHNVVPYSPEQMAYDWFPKYWWRVVAVLAMLLVCVRLPAQVTASFSPQPLAAFKAAFGSKLDGVAVFEVTVCNRAALGVEVPAGRITQSQTEIATVNRDLATRALSKARRSSKKYRFARAFFWASLGGSALIGADVVSASAQVAAIFPFLAGLSERLSGEFEGEIPDASSFGWLTGTLALPPGDCTSRLLLGDYRRGRQPFTVEVR